MHTTRSADIMFSRRSIQAADQPIGKLMSQALANPGLISLAAGFVDPETLPVRHVAELTAEIFADERTGKEALQYGTTSGHSGLRKQIFDTFVRPDFSQSCPLTPDNIVITAGSNQILHLVAESLIDPGDIVIAAAPSYFVFLGSLAELGAQVIGVRADADGIDTEQLSGILEELDSSGQLHRLKAIYLVSYFDNPAGSTLSTERRERVISLAREYSRESRIMVLSDDAYRPLRFDVPDLPSMVSLNDAADYVITAGTFSKSFSPGIRVGWGLLPTEVCRAVTNQKNNLDFGSPNLNQIIVQRALETGIYSTHVDLLREAYQSKRDTMLAAAERYLGGIEGVRWRRPGGGLYVWLTLPPQLSASPAGPLFHLAVNHGVLYVPGQYCFPDVDLVNRTNTIRLSFGVESHERISEGIKILAESIKETLTALSS
ncbi:MAG: PLP-dependent aminotransferase family protein [Pirellulaceae bacterium]